MAATDDNPDPRYFGCQEGYVIDNRDPKGLHRVRVDIPGLMPEEGSTWAWPMGGLGGGGPQRGSWDAPEIGAEVYCWFLNGDPEKVRYMPGHHGKEEEPSAVKAAKEEANSGSGKTDASLQVKVVHETKEWQIVIDERPGKRRLYINAKALGEDMNNSSALIVELDREQGVLGLVGIGGVAIRSTGLIDIQGSVIQIGGRKVIQGINKAI